MLLCLCSGFILVGQSCNLPQFSVIVSLTTRGLDAYLDSDLDHFPQVSSQPWVSSANWASLPLVWWRSHKTVLTGFTANLASSWGLMLLLSQKHLVSPFALGPPFLPLCGLNFIWNLSSRLPALLESLHRECYTKCSDTHWLHFIRPLYV